MAVHNYTIVASPKNYWISPYALSISLNALGEPDRIQASTSSGAVIFCHFKNYAEIGDGSTFGFDVAHGFKSWPLTAAPTYFNSYSAKYLYVAIPRTANAGTYAMVVFPSDMIDIYGRKVYESPMPRQDDEGNYLDADGNIVSYDEAEMLYELVMDNDEPIQVGSENYYYIWLQGVITSSVNGTSPRDWQTIPHYDTGQLDTAESWGEVITLEQLAREMKKKVDVDWFKRIFAIHGTNLHRMIVSGSDEDNPEYVTDEFGNVIYGGEDDSARDIQPNDMEHEITDVESKFGFWTERFLSALGTPGGSEGGEGGGEGGEGGEGGGGVLELRQPLYGINNAGLADHPLVDGQTIVWKNGGWTYDTAGNGDSIILQDDAIEVQPSYVDGSGVKHYNLSANWLSLAHGGTISDNIIVNNAYLTLFHPNEFDPTSEYVGNQVLTKAETLALADARYVKIDWFKKLFRAQGASGDIEPNAGTTVTSIKAIVGLWTESYLSALGTNGNSSGFSLGALLNTLNTTAAIQGTPSSSGQTIVWNGSSWSFGTAGGDTYTHPTNGANTSIIETAGTVISSITVNSLGHVTAVGSTSGYLTETAADNKYLTKAFFNKLFRARGASGDITVNDVDTTVTSIKAMFGLWTESYLSALGTNGNSSGFSLGTLLNTLNTTTAIQGTPSSSGQTIVWNGSSWSFGTAGGISTSDLDTYMGGKSWWGQTLSNGVVTGAMTGVTTIDNLLNLDTTNYRIEIVGGNTAKAQLGYTPSTNIPYLRFGVPSGSVADVASFYQKTSNGTTLYHLILGQLGRQTYIVGDSVRLYAPSSGGGFSPCLHTLTGGKVFIQGNGDSADYTNAQTYDYELYVSNSIFTKNLYLYRTNNAGTPIEAYLSGSRADSVNTISVNNANLSVPGGNISTQSSNGAYVQIGAMRLVYDSGNNAIKVVKMDGTTETNTGNLYAMGGISALGTQGSGSGGLELGTVLSHINQHSPATFAPTSGFLYYNNGYWTGWTTNQLTSTLDSTFVTLSTQQTISGNKTFSGAVAISNTGSINSVNGFVHASISGDNTARNAYVLLAGGGYKSLSEIGGGGATLGSILDNINSHSPNSFGVTSNSLLYYNSSENLWGTRAFSDFVTVSDAQTITGGKTFTGANTFSGTNTFNAAVTIGQDGSISSYNGFVKSNIVGASTNEQRDAYVLLAGGGHKALSEIGGGGTDELVKVVETNPSNETAYYLMWTAAANGNTTNGLINDGFKYSTKEGVANTAGIATLILGNNIVSTQAKSKKGQIRIYAENTKYCSITAPAAPSDHRAVTLPNDSGILALTKNIPTNTSQLTNDSGFLTSHQSLSNYVTLDGTQTITGAKTFNGTASFAGGITLASSITPNQNEQYGLGTSSKTFASLYVKDANVSGTLTVGTFSITNLSVSGTSSLAKGAKFYSVCIECKSDGTADTTNRSGEINRYTGDLHLEYDSAAKTSGNVPHGITLCNNGGTVAVGTTLNSTKRNYKLYVNGDSYLAGKLYVNGTPPSGNSPQAYVNGGTYLNGVTQIDGNLSILNSKNLTVTGNASVNGTLTVGTMSFTNLSVSGTSKLSGNVGIGTDPDSGTTYKLKVSGRASCGSIKISDFLVTDNGSRIDINTSNGVTNKNVYVTGTWYGTFQSGSDMRMKDIDRFIDNMNVEQVALAPVFDFRWKDARDSRLHLGTSAQYWRDLLPQAVSTMNDGILAMDYGATALAAAVITARKVVDHERIIKELEAESKRQREEINELEQENERLRTEIEQLKAA